MKTDNIKKGDLVQVALNVAISSPAKKGDVGLVIKVFGDDTEFPIQVLRSNGVVTSFTRREVEKVLS